MTDPVPVQARCYRHPNREAGVRCTRCDRPICPECMRPAAVGFHCPDDVNLARKTTRTPRTAVGANAWHSSVPYLTSALIAVNVAIYLITASQAVGGLSQAGDGSSKLFRDWQLVPETIHLHDSYYRLLTAAFLHVSLLHIGSNMLALAIIGPPLERLLGPWRFASVYFLAAIGGNAAVYAFGQANTPEVGASGAIFGLFAASVVMVRKLGLDPQWLIGTIVLNFVLTFSIHNISKLGHIGGFVVGAIAAVAIAGLPGATQRLRTQTQVLGLGVTAVLVVLVIVGRTASF